VRLGAGHPRTTVFTTVLLPFTVLCASWCRSSSKMPRPCGARERHAGVEWQATTAVVKWQEKRATIFACSRLPVSADFHAVDAAR
jgi:hypothetical protein